MNKELQNECGFSEFDQRMTELGVFHSWVYEMIITSIMKKQYKNIFISNKKKKQKCTRSKRLIPHERDLTREETQSLISFFNISVESLVSQLYKAESPVLQSQSQAPQKCSNCGTVGHTRRTCPNPSLV